jgi:DNA-binding transcriptional LysR family regulator
VPRGLLRVSATLGFGRRHVAPALSRFARDYPEVEVQLHLSDRPVNLVEQGFDLQVRFGELPDARLTARLLARNERVLCASPAYLQRAGTPSRRPSSPAMPASSSARATRPTAPGTCGTASARRP